MTRRERLMRTMRGQPVDRPPVSFYEIGFFNYNVDDPNPYNVHNDPSWRPLLELAYNQTDIIRAVYPRTTAVEGTTGHSLWHYESEVKGESTLTRATLKLPRRTLTQLTRRDAATDTVWTVEHLMKEPGDIDAFLEVPAEEWAVAVDCTAMLEVETALGEAGIVCVDTGDPLCSAAAMFSMADYTVVAMTEGERFHRLLAHFLECQLPVTESVAQQFPGRLWRICGSEYASEPYLPPRLFCEYVNGYTGHLVHAIRATGGFARIHSHGRLRGILQHIAAMEADGLDPVEPPPQGDMELYEVRQAIGRDTVLFGNIEAADIENLTPLQFEPKVRRALEQGTYGAGRGFVLMPSACPYGRHIGPDVLENYRLMVRLAKEFTLSDRPPGA